jgi:hypothetical protein
VQSSTEECTIAVVSGSVTDDGRPLLWKNRDTAYVDNEIVYFDDGLYPYLALVSAGETNNAWMGVNSRGFAVLNALSHNLPDIFQGGITNGALMKLALQTCGTVDDFQNLLIQTNVTGRDNPANLAVIDASGGASMFEAGNRSFVRYDADGSALGPNGFVVRANLSLSADTTGWNTWRFRRATALVQAAVANRKAQATDLLRVSRDLCTATINPYPLPYEGSPPYYPDAYGYVDASETINRQSSVAGGVIRGVQLHEDPRLSTYYALVGHPEVTPAVPLWVAAGPTPPEMDGPVTSPMCDAARARRQACFDYPGNPSLINTMRLTGAASGGRDFIPLVAHIEGRLLPEAEQDLVLWRAAGVISPGEMAKAERDMASSAYKEYTGSGASPVTASLRFTPNPSRGETGIWYELTSKAVSPWALEIFDVSGRLVARLDQPSEGDLVSATGPIRWNGRDRRGAPVPSGVYFCRPAGQVRGEARSFTIVR